MMDAERDVQAAEARHQQPVAPGEGAEQRGRAERHEGEPHRGHDPDGEGAAGDDPGAVEEQPDAREEIEVAGARQRDRDDRAGGERRGETEGEPGAPGSRAAAAACGAPSTTWWTRRSPPRPRPARAMRPASSRARPAGSPTIRPATVMAPISASPHPENAVNVDARSIVRRMKCRSARARSCSAGGALLTHAGRTAKGHDGINTPQGSDLSSTL